MLSLEKAIYQLFIWLYGKAILAASLFNNKAKLWIQGRKNIFHDLEQFVDPAISSVWIHCASLGEFEQGRPLLERIKLLYPDAFIILTFYSPSGFEIRKNYEYADFVCYLPLDTKLNAKRFVDAINPNMAIFVKYEFWLNHLFELHHRNIPTYLISSIFRNDQPFFRWYGNFYRSVLKQFNHVFVQNERSMRLLNGIGMSQVSLASDTRFDRVASIKRYWFKTQ